MSPLSKGQPGNSRVCRGSKAIGGFKSKMYGFQEGRHNVILTSPQMNEYAPKRAGLGQQKISSPPPSLFFFLEIKNYIKASPSAHTKCHCL